MGKGSSFTSRFRQFWGSFWLCSGVFFGFRVFFVCFLKSLLFLAQQWQVAVWHANKRSNFMENSAAADTMEQGEENFRACKLKVQMRIKYAACFLPQFCFWHTHWPFLVPHHCHAAHNHPMQWDLQLITISSSSSTLLQALAVSQKSNAASQSAAHSFIQAGVCTLSLFPSHDPPTERSNLLGHRVHQKNPLNFLSLSPA